MNLSPSFPPLNKETSFASSDWVINMLLIIAIFIAIITPGHLIKIVMVTGLSVVVISLILDNFRKIHENEKKLAEYKSKRVFATIISARGKLLTFEWSALGSLMFVLAKYKILFPQSSGMFHLTLFETGVICLSFGIASLVYTIIYEKVAAS